MEKEDFSILRVWSFTGIHIISLGMTVDGEGTLNLWASLALRIPFGPWSQKPAFLINSVFFPTG